MTQHQQLQATSPGADQKDDVSPAAISAQLITTMIYNWYTSCSLGGYTADTGSNSMLPGPIVISRIDIEAQRLTTTFTSHTLSQAEHYQDYYRGYNLSSFSPIAVWQLPTTRSVTLGHSGMTIVLPYAPPNHYAWDMDGPGAPLANIDPSLKLEPYYYPSSQGSPLEFWFVTAYLHSIQVAPLTVAVNLNAPGLSVQFPDMQVQTVITPLGGGITPDGIIQKSQNQASKLHYVVTSRGGIQHVGFTTPVHSMSFADASAAGEPTQWSISLAGIDFSERNGIDVDIGTLQPYSQIQAFTFGQPSSASPRLATLNWQSTSPLSWYITVPNRAVYTKYFSESRTLVIDNDSIVFAGNTPQVYTLLDPEGRPLQ